MFCVPPIVPPVAAVMSSEWISFDWSDYDGTKNYYSKSIPIPRDVMDIIVDGGVFLVYFQVNPQHYGGGNVYNTTLTIPYTNIYINTATTSSANSIESIRYTLRHSSNSSEMSIYLHCATPMFRNSEKKFVDRIRYVVIPKGVSISRVNPNPTIDDWKKLNYNQVQNILNLKDSKKL